MYTQDFISISVFTNSTKDNIFIENDAKPVYRQKGLRVSTLGFNLNT